MEIFSKEFIDTFDIKGITPGFSIDEEFRKLGRGIVFQGCDGYGFVGLAFDGITRSVVYIENPFKNPAFKLVPYSNLSQYFIDSILPNI